MNLNDYKNQLRQRIRVLDVELSEDLYRRMPDCNSIYDLNMFFHGILSHYKPSTTIIRATLVDGNDFEIWYVNFIKNVLPFLIKHRLPTCTNLEVKPTYTVTTTTRS